MVSNELILVDHNDKNTLNCIIISNEIWAYSKAPVAPFTNMV